MSGFGSSPMSFCLFGVAPPTVVRGVRAGRGPFSHRFGGPADWAGLDVGGGRPPIHVLFSLDASDPRVEVAPPGVDRVPLLCAIRYGACGLGYRVDPGRSVRILFLGESEPWDRFPFEGYPDELPVEPITLVDEGYDPDQPRDVLRFAGIFGYDSLTPGQFGRAVRMAEVEGLYEPELSDFDTAEEFVRGGNALPFEQGPPADPCPNPACARHDQPGSLRTFAVFREADDRWRGLWGPSGGNLQIIYQQCPDCRAFMVVNQCS